MAALLQCQSRRPAKLVLALARWLDSVAQGSVRGRRLPMRGCARSSHRPCQEIKAAL